MGMDTEFDAGHGSPQLAFFAEDLAAVDRARTPWVVFVGHRPMYSSAMEADGHNLRDGPWWPDVEEVLLAHRVDLCIYGHVHNAEVTCPMARGRCVEPSVPGGYAAPVHAVVGNAGQSITPFPTGPPPAWSRWRLAEFGYATLEIQGPSSLDLRFFADAAP